MPSNETDDNITDPSPEFSIVIDGDEEAVEDTAGDQEQAAPPVPSDEADSQSDSPALLDGLKDAVSEEPESAEPSEDDGVEPDEEIDESDESATPPEPESAEKEKESADDGQEEPRIPKRRLDQVIKQRNELRPEAESWRNLRKAYQDVGVTDQAFESFQETGLLIARNDPSALPRIKALAEAVGFQVVEKIPAELQSLVDNGSLDEEAARQLAAQHRAPPAQAQPTEPTRFTQGYTESHAQQDIQEVVANYEDQYSDLMADKSVQAEIQAEFKRLVNEVVDLTGTQPKFDKFGSLTDRAIKAVIEPRTQVRRPTETPLRPSPKPAQRPGPIKSAADYVARELRDI